MVCITCVEGVRRNVFRIFLRSCSALQLASFRKALGKLREHRVGMFCIFISHQWLGNVHPDPTVSQFKILKAQKYPKFDWVEHGICFEPLGMMLRAWEICCDDQGSVELFRQGFEHIHPPFIFI